jgi:uncharacterized membrane protein
MTDYTIRSPIDWVGSQVAHVVHAASAIGHALHHAVETMHAPVPAVQQIGTAELREALAKGWDDLGAYRSDVFFIAIICPLLALVVGRVAFYMNLLPLLFPMASGFALIGPLAAVGLYEMSRQREEGLEINWRNGIDVIRRPAIGGIAILGLIVTALFLLWLVAAWVVFEQTLGPTPPTSFVSFASDVVGTTAGRWMMVIGIAVGLLFALVALAIGAVSFPLLVDRDVGFDTAIRTSIRAMRVNPTAMLAWGAIVTVGLIASAATLFIGLAVVLPMLGHATWHLYRRLVPNDQDLVSE